jgi:hypothetical protein
MSPTGQEHANEDPQADAPKPETRQEKRKNIKRITFDLNQTKSPINIRDRLGPRLNPWNAWIEGQEPVNHETWSRQELIDELRRLKAHQEVKEPQFVSQTSQTSQTLNVQKRDLTSRYYNNERPLCNKRVFTTH